MGKILKHQLRVDNLEGLSSFYGDLLGMEEFESDTNTKTFGFTEGSCQLEFCKEPVTGYNHKANDLYWKIGITLQNLDVAVKHLRDQGIEAAQPFQFRDIGYMSRIVDPRGFSIELLQQGFEGNEISVEKYSHPIGSQATLAHITLRVKNFEKSHQYFTKTCGMRLMSVQPVDEYGFCLYFYSYGTEKLPNSDLKAVENRQWLWARPYAFIELQHLQRLHLPLNKPRDDISGFKGIYIDKENNQNTFITAQELMKNTE